MLAIDIHPSQRASRANNPVNRKFSSRIARLSLLFTPLGASWSKPALAEADAKAVAASHFARGVDLANEGAYSAALIEFSRAYETSPHYTVLYNMGQAYIGLGKPVEAVQMLRRYLNEGGAHIAIERRHEVEAEIVKQFARTGTVRIEVNAPGATLSIDGEPVGAAPLENPVRLPIGAHRIRAELGGQQAEQTLTLAGEEALTIRLELAQPPEAAPAVVATSGWVRIACSFKDVAVSVDGVPRGFTPLAAPIELPVGAHSVHFRDAAHPQGTNAPLSIVAGQSVRADCGFPIPVEHPHSSRSTWGYVIGAVGIGLGGAAAAHFAWNLGRYHDWNDQYDDYSSQPSAARRESANALGASIERASIVTIGLGIGAGLALGTGTLLIVTDGAPANNRSNAGRTWLAWRGQF